MINKIKFPEVTDGPLTGDHYEIMKILNEIADHLNYVEWKNNWNLTGMQEYFDGCSREGD